MAYVIVAIAVVVFGVIGFRGFFRSRQTRSQRRRESAEPARLVAPVSLKRDSARGWWRGARGFTLIVTDKAFAIAGPGESQSWYFAAPESTMRWEQTETTNDWIVLEGTDSGKRVRLHISPAEKGRLWETWSALVSEGVVPLTDPPL